MIAALRQALYKQSNVVLCVLFFPKSCQIYTIFLFVSFEKEKSLKPARGFRTQDPPCENGHIFSAECTGLFLNYLTRLIAALRQARYTDVVLCVILFYLQPYQNVTGFTRFLCHPIRLRGGSGPPRCKWTTFFVLI